MDGQATCWVPAVPHPSPKIQKMSHNRGANAHQRHDAESVDLSGWAVRDAAWRGVAAWRRGRAGRGGGAGGSESTEIVQTAAAYSALNLLRPLLCVLLLLLDQPARREETNSVSPLVIMEMLQHLEKDPCIVGKR